MVKNDEIEFDPEKAKVLALPFRFLDNIQNHTDLALFLNECLESSEEFSHALGLIGREAGMAELARRSGLQRESLYKALSYHSKPEFRTILLVLKAFGLQLKVIPKEDQ